MLGGEVEAARRAWKPVYGPMALLLGLIIGLFGGVIAEEIGHAAGYSLTSPPPAVTDAATVLQDLGFVGAVVFFARKAAPLSVEALGLLRTARVRRALLAMAVVLLSFFVFSAVWAAALHIHTQERQVIKDLGGNAGTLGIIGALAVTCVLAPICEEVLFRGFMFRALSNWRGPWVAAAITGVVFGGIHAGSAPVGDLVPLAFLGGALCLLYRETGSLYPCIALHAINNAIAFGANESWDWQIPVVLASSLASIALVIAAIRRVSAPRTV